LTKLEDFVGPAGQSRTGNHWHSSLIISQSTGVSADLQFRWFELSGELPLPIEQNETMVVTGNSYAYTVTCATVRGSAEPGSGFFTATTQELILFSAPNPNGVTRVLTYTRE
jgi:hypothetical protein